MMLSAPHRQQDDDVYLIPETGADVVVTDMQTTREELTPSTSFEHGLPLQSAMGGGRSQVMFNFILVCA
jgi:hypothetical protein